jgi:anaphase-promoting complex subunit 10
MNDSVLFSEKEHLLEIGDKAVWSLTSVKPGNGVEKFRDDNLDTFWQSDGVQPHKVTIQFHKIVQIEEIAIYIDLKHDESYTPKELLIKGKN